MAVVAVSQAFLYLLDAGRRPDTVSNETYAM